MVSKVVDPEYASTKVPQIPVKCRHCAFFKRNATYSAPCATLGRDPSDKPCPRFMIDYKSLTIKKDTPLEALAQVLNRLDKRHLAVVAAFVLQARSTFDAGFELGQIVYFRPFGDDYLSNYQRAKVLFAVPKNGMVYVNGKASHAGGMHAYLKISSVLTEEEWRTKRAKLLKDGKVDDPKNPIHKVQKANREKYEPPMMDLKGKKSSKSKTTKGKAAKKAISLR